MAANNYDGPHTEKKTTTRIVYGYSTGIK